MDTSLLSKMKADWDARARENARFFVQTEKKNWSDSEFFQSGRINVQNEIVPDLPAICGSRPPQDLRVLEIGCGVGRLTRALAEIFGEVHGIDISEEMIRQAKINLSDCNNVYVYQGNGCDLSAIPHELVFDFAFSFIVFQHIPSQSVIENYIAEVSLRLIPGSLFKFQVQGGQLHSSLAPDDTWLGASFTIEEMQAIAERHGFTMAGHHGEGTQYFWLWFVKN